MMEIQKIFEEGRKARVNGLKMESPYNDEKTEPWIAGWIDEDLRLGQKKAR